MSKISKSTRDTIKKQILKVLKKKAQSTFAISEQIGRSWELTLSLLIELKREGKIKETRIANVRAWAKK